MTLEFGSRGVTFRPALLKGESSEEFGALIVDLYQDLQPRHVTQRMYVEDVALLIWDILRYRRAKVAIINNASQRGLHAVLKSALLGEAHVDKADGPARSLAFECEFLPEVRERIRGILEEMSLDPWAAEAEAIRLHLDEIERLDRLIASTEIRRDKALMFLSQFNESFAKKLLESSDRLLYADIEANAVPPGVVPS